MDTSVRLSVMDTLTVVNNGSVREVPLLRQKKDAVRFAVGRFGHQSSLWRVFAQKGPTSDLFLGVQSRINDFKLSFHQSGIWRYAATEEYLNGGGAFPVAEDGDRVGLRWQRPEPEDGWIRAMDIMVAHGHLHDGEPLVSVEKFIWLPEPDWAQMSTISLHICYGDRPPFIEDGRAVVGALAIGGGGVAVVSYVISKITLPERMSMSIWVNEQRERVRADGKLPLPQIVTCVIFDLESKYPRVIDLSLGIVTPL